MIDQSALPWLAAASWVVYGGIHSTLASSRIKNRLSETFPRLTPYYRFAYNLLAVLLLLIPAGLMSLDKSAAIFAWRYPFNWLAHFAALAAIGGFLWSLKYYDLREFVGFPDAGRPGGFEISALKISSLHRFVRHPWYFFMLVIIWTRDMNPTQLVSAVVITLYLIVGSRLEENKLIAQFGNRYRNYRRRVGGLIPLPWKILGRGEQAEFNVKK